MKALPVFVGFDQREAIAYHVFCQSVLERASAPVAFVPLAANALARVFTRTRGHDGSNAFTYSRFLVPYLMGFQGWALFADGDMVCNADVVDLFLKADPAKAVMVVKHDYRTKHPTKYLGAVNQDYDRKNQSSLILWNCAHPANAVLTPEMVSLQPGKYLHRFWWLNDEQVGALPLDWNWLVGEFEAKAHAKIHHHTIGVPAFSTYARWDNADLWHRALLRAVHAEGEDPVEIVRRAKELA